MAIELPKLPFSVDALEPHLSRRTLEFHYGKHHRNYVETLNDLIQNTSLDNYSLEEIMIASYRNKQKIYNNAAQVWNHSFMWNCLTKKGSSPSENVQKAIARKFGSLDEFKNKFIITAVTSLRVCHLPSPFAAPMRTCTLPPSFRFRK